MRVINWDNSMYAPLPPEPSIDVIDTPEDQIREMIQDHIDETTYEHESIAQEMDIEDIKFQELIRHDTSCKQQLF